MSSCVSLYLNIYICYQLVHCIGKRYRLEIATMENSEKVSTFISGLIHKSKKLFTVCIPGCILFVLVYHKKYFVFLSSKTLFIKQWLKTLLPDWECSGIFGKKAKSNSIQYCFSLIDQTTISYSSPR